MALLAILAILAIYWRYWGLLLLLSGYIEERLRPKRTDARWIVEYPGRNMVPPPAAEDAGCRDVDERPQHGNTHDEGCADQWPIGPITVLVKKTDQRNLAHSIIEIQPNAPYIKCSLSMSEACPKRIVHKIN